MCCLFAVLFLDSTGRTGGVILPECIVAVRDKIAQVQGNPVIVCGNSDYTVSFDLDSEWDGISDITAQVAYMQNGRMIRENVPVNGGVCSLPVISGAAEILVGVYGGSIRTAAPAVIPCLPCVTDIHGTLKMRRQDAYDEMMEVIANA